jgi:hypothetical protein
MTVYILNHRSSIVDKPLEKKSIRHMADQNGIRNRTKLLKKAGPFATAPENG